MITRPQSREVTTARQREWHPRVSRESPIYAKHRKRARILAVVAIGIVVFAAYTSAQHGPGTVLPQSLMWLFWIWLIGYRMGLDYSAWGQAPITILALDHDPDRDALVAISYRQKDIEIGSDVGWLRRQDDGYFFSGLQTEVFLGGVTALEKGVGTTKPTRDSETYAVVRATFPPTPNLIGDPADRLQAVLADDGITAPPATNRTPPPTIFQPRKRFLLFLEFLTFWSLVVLIVPAMTVSIWARFVGSSVEENTRILLTAVGILAIIAAYTLAFRDYYPATLAKLKLMRRLDQISIEPPAIAETS